MAVDLQPPRRNPERRLSPNECRAWVSSHREGRLGYLSGRGPRSVVVAYAMAEDAILVELPDYNDAAHYVPGMQVHFDVEGPAVSRRDAVRVTGTAVLADRRHTPSADAELSPQWPAGIATSVIRLPLHVLEGVEGEAV